MAAYCTGARLRALPVRPDRIPDADLDVPCVRRRRAWPALHSGRRPGRKPPVSALSATPVLGQQPCLVRPCATTCSRRTHLAQRHSPPPPTGSIWPASRTPTSPLQLNTNWLHLHAHRTRTAGRASRTSPHGSISPSSPRRAAAPDRRHRQGELHRARARGSAHRAPSRAGGHRAGPGPGGRLGDWQRAHTHEIVTLDRPGRHRAPRTPEGGSSARLLGRTSCTPPTRTRRLVAHPGGG